MIGNLRLNVRVTSRFDLQEKMAAMEAQVKQLGLQAAHDCERMSKDRTVTLQLLHKVSLSPLINRQYRHVFNSLKCDAWQTEKAPLCPCWLCILGARQVVCPGEEVPQPDRREDLPKGQQQHERGEQ